MNPQIISLDLETSGANLADGVTILSIGMEHLATGETYYQEIKHDLLMVEPRASRVHGLDMNSLDLPEAEFAFTASLAAAEEVHTPNRRIHMGACDLAAREWLQQFSEKPGKLLALGWNIAGFDMPFVRKYLSKTNAWFSRRTIDMNALCFFFDVAGNQPLLEAKALLKKQCKNQYTHNALADAKAAAEGFRYLVRQIQEN